MPRFYEIITVYYVGTSGAVGYTAWDNRYERTPPHKQERSRYIPPYLLRFFFLNHSGSRSVCRLPPKDSTTSITKTAAKPSASHSVKGVLSSATARIAAVTGSEKP